MNHGIFFTYSHKVEKKKIKPPVSQHTPGITMFDSTIYKLFCINSQTKDGKLRLGLQSQTNHSVFLLTGTRAGSTGFLETLLLDDEARSNECTGSDGERKPYQISSIHDRENSRVCSIGSGFFI